jgi:hypothetical protein
MGALIANLLPLIIGAAVGGPAWIIMSLILLRSEDGVVKATAFAAGAITVRVLQFALFGRLFGAIASAQGKDVFDLIPSTLLLVAGLLLVATAVKTWWSKGEDSDAPPPRWMTALGGVSALTAFGMAVAMMVVGTKQWVFTLSAIAVIDDAYLGKIGTILAYLFFILAAHSLTLTPIIGTFASPTKAAKIVDIMLHWLQRNQRAITIAISLIFGAWFLSRSTSDLLAHAGEPPISKAPATY